MFADKASTEYSSENYSEQHHENNRSNSSQSQNKVLKIKRLSKIKNFLSITLNRKKGLLLIFTKGNPKNKANKA
jgi:hypothetical protein